MIRYPDLPQKITQLDVEGAMRELGLPIDQCMGVTIGIRTVEVTYRALDEKGSVFITDDNEVATHTFSIPIETTR